MAEDHVVVKVSEGLLKGKWAKTVTGFDYVSFLGVPFAKPPIGDLRFQAPQPPEPWEGTRDALNEGSPSIGMDILNFTSIVGSEDCLYLNIYTPKIPVSKNDRKLPVMFNIHGGGFVMCNGNMEFCGPDFLIPEGVVLVSANYRLGILGFLSTEDEVCPGNWGLKDQVAALRWVNKNISNFGGDPENITIFGISAGGGSVHYHMISPLSKGHFQRAIAQSGVCLNPWAITTESRERAFRLGELFGKKTKNSRELVEFLKTVDPIELASKMNDAKSEEDKKKVFDFGFVPCIEPDIEGAFLPGNPIDLLRNNKTYDVPFILGSTSAEGLAIFSLTGINTVTEKINEYIEGPISNFVPKIRLNSADVANMDSEIRKLYFSDAVTTQDKINSYVELLGDMTFCEGIISVVRNLATSPQRKAPIYQYHFTNEETPALTSFYRPDGCKGANHGADATLIFSTTLCEHNIDPNSNEQKLRKIIIRLWTDFAKYGDPTPSINDVVGVRWDPYTKENPSYLEINLPLKKGKDLRKEKMDFWSERLPPCSILPPL